MAGGTADQFLKKPQGTYSYPRPTVTPPKPSTTGNTAANAIVKAITQPIVVKAPATPKWGPAVTYPRPSDSTLAAQVNQQLDASAPQQDNSADLMAQLLAMGNTGGSSKKSGGRRRRGGGGGGGGGGGVSPAVHDAMLAYLNYLQTSKDQSGKPFDDREERLNAAAAEGRSSIGSATSLLQQHIAAAQQQAQQQAQMRNAAQQQLAQQYGAASGDAFQRALADLRAQGIGTGSLEAQNMANQQAWANNQQQLGQANTTRDAALQQYLANQSATGQLAAAGGTQGLENTRLNLFEQIAQQRAAAAKAVEDQMQQFRLQMAQAGVTPP